MKIRKKKKNKQTNYQQNRWETFIFFYFTDKVMKVSILIFYQIFLVRILTVVFTFLFLSLSHNHGLIARDFEFLSTFYTYTLQSNITF